MATPEGLLEDLFTAASAARKARERVIASTDPEGMVTAVEAVITRDFEVAPGPDHEEATFRLEAVADVLGALPGERSATLLVRILGHEDPTVRTAAGETLVHLLYDRYGEVCRVFERAVEKGTDVNALSEIPYLLSEVGEPGGLKIVLRLLQHADGDVVCAAIDAIAAFGDPTAINALRRLVDDGRMVLVDPEADEEAPLGTLAREAIEHLQALQKLT